MEARAIWPDRRFDQSEIIPIARRYVLGQPFPHVVIDDFFASDLAEAIESEFPSQDDPVWLNHGQIFALEGKGEKREHRQLSAMGPALQRSFEAVQSPEFIDYVSRITNVPDLRPDPQLYGGGLNLVGNGGFLEIHADFNFNSDLGAYRAVNLLVYFNRDWREEFGGCLELWDSDLSGPPKVLTPAFNRAVIFATNTISYHGYRAINEPHGRPRRSMNVYYYTDTPAEGVHADPHRTIWKKKLH